MEMTTAKSSEQAVIIDLIKIDLQNLDLEYCKEVAKKLESTASKQEAMAVLNPSYDQNKNRLLRIQSAALQHLINFAEKLKECDEIGKKIATDTSTRLQIQRMFM